MKVNKSKEGERHYYSALGVPVPAVASEVWKALFPPAEPKSPSVTTILGALAKPALIGWAAKEERRMLVFLAGRLYERLDAIVDEPITPEKFAELLDEDAGKPANRKLLARAGKVGTEVHKRIEWMFKGELGLLRDTEPPALTSPQAERAFQRWEEWRIQVHLTPLAIEKRVYSATFGFGGTLDLLAEVDAPGDDTRNHLSPDEVIPVRDKIVVDFKTGKAVYAEAFLQNAAYRLALQEEGIVTHHGVIVRLPKYEDDPEFDVVVVPDDSNLTTVFLALGIVYRWWDQQQRKNR